MTTSAPEPTYEQARRRPRLAVLIPVFNAQRGLERSLASLEQDGERFEVIVVDDGSTPPVTLPETLPFPTALIRLPSNQGITTALNAGLGHIVAAGFQYVARLDAGDLSLPGRFAAQMAFLDVHPDHAVVGTHVEVVDAAGRYLYDFRPPTSHAGLASALRYRNAISHPSVMMRSAVLTTAGFYVSHYPGGEDYELWLRLARRYRLANLDRILVRKEETTSSITARRLRLGISRLRLQFAHFDPRSIHAYLGIARSLAVLCTSRGMLLRLMRLQAPSRPT
jgi:glycosyltransferase involved in cell wall biosynthesis